MLRDILSNSSSVTSHSGYSWARRCITVSNDHILTIRGAGRELVMPLGAIISLEEHAYHTATGGLAAKSQQSGLRCLSLRAMLPIGAAHPMLLPSCAPQTQKNEVDTLWENSSTVHCKLGPGSLQPAPGVSVHSQVAPETVPPAPPYGAHSSPFMQSTSSPTSLQTATSGRNISNYEEREVEILLQFASASNMQLWQASFTRILHNFEQTFMQPVVTRLLVLLLQRLRSAADTSLQIDPYRSHDNSVTSDTVTSTDPGTADVAAPVSIFAAARSGLTYSSEAIRAHMWACMQQRSLADLKANGMNDTAASAAAAPSNSRNDHGDRSSSRVSSGVPLALMQRPYAISLWKTVPVPALHIILLAVGTRGDFDPYLALGIQLQARGHQVRIGSHACYAHEVKEAGLDFFPIAGDPHRLSAVMAQCGGKPLFPTPAVLRTYPQHLKDMEEIMQSCWDACHATTDHSSSLASARTSINEMDVGTAHKQEFHSAENHLDLAGVTEEMAGEEEGWDGEVLCTGVPRVSMPATQVPSCTSHIQKAAPSFVGPFVCGAKEEWSDEDEDGKDTGIDAGAGENNLAENVTAGSMTDRFPSYLPDCIIANPVTFVHAHLAESFLVPLMVLFPQPWTPSKGFPHPLAGKAYDMPPVTSRFLEPAVLVPTPPPAQNAAEYSDLTPDESDSGDSPGNNSIDDNDDALSRTGSKRSLQDEEEEPRGFMAACLPHFVVPPLPQAQPQTRTRGNAHPPLPLPSQSTTAWSIENRLTYAVTEKVIWAGLEAAINRLRCRSLGLQPVTYGEGYSQVLHERRVPFAITASPLLVARPKDYPSYVQIVGSNAPSPWDVTHKARDDGDSSKRHFSQRTTSATHDGKYAGPDKTISVPSNCISTSLPTQDSDVPERIRLQTFLHDGTSVDSNSLPPIFIGFGSMVPSKEVLEKGISLLLQGIAQLLPIRRVIVQAGWSLLSHKTFTRLARDAEHVARMLRMADEGSVSTCPSPHVQNQEQQTREWTIADALLLRDNYDHGQLFNQVAAVIHHGGAGTTCSGLRCGKPT